MVPKRHFARVACVIGGDDDCLTLSTWRALSCALAGESSWAEWRDWFDSLRLAWSLASRRSEGACEMAKYVIKLKIEWNVCDWASNHEIVRLASANIWRCEIRVSSWNQVTMRMFRNDTSITWGITKLDYESNSEICDSTKALVQKHLL